MAQQKIQRFQCPGPARALAVTSLLAASAIAAASGAAAAPRGFVVIQNLNAPHDCKVIAEDAAFIQIYRKVYGPAQKGIAERYARTRCKPPAAAR